MLNRARVPDKLAATTLPSHPPTWIQIWVSPRRRVLRQGQRLLRSFLRCALPAAAGNSKADSRYALKLADHSKQIIRAWISLWTEHAHQALGRRARRLRQLLKSHGRVDIVTQNRFTDFNLASNELLNGFGQKRFTKRYIALGALYRARRVPLPSP